MPVTVLRLFYSGIIRFDYRKNLCIDHSTPLESIKGLNQGGTSKNQRSWLFEVPYGTLSIEGRLINQWLTIQAFMFPSPKPPSR